MKNKKSDVRNIIALGATSFFNDMASEMIYPLLPAFLAIQLGAGPAGLGLVEGVAETTSSVMKYYSGWLSDKLRKRKAILFSGYVFSNVVRPLISIVGQWWQLLFLRFADRVGKGVRTAPRDALLADSVSENHRALAFSFHRAMDHSGALVGPLIAWLLMAKFSFDYRQVFIWSLIPGLIVIAIIMLFVRERVSGVDIKEKKAAGNADIYKARKQRRDSPDNSVDLHRPHKLQKAFYLYLMAIIIFTLGNSSDAFLLLLAQNKGIGASVIPVLWAVLHISKTVFSFLGGWLGDRWSKRGIVSTGWFVYGLVYLGFAFAGEAGVIWLLFVIYGIYFGLCEGSEKALVADLTPPEQYGRSYGLYNLAVGIGALPASVIFGIIWKVVGYKAAFITGATLAIIAAVLLNILRIKKENDK